jgi:phytoene dehydrogenase-like protein
VPDVVVVGAGPNGLAAALTCAKAGRSVLVLEAMETIGGGARTAELTLPGFAHDVCSAIHPLAAVSPFFAGAGLDAYGLELLHTEVALAHPLADGRAGVLRRSVAETVDGLGVDGTAWDRHIGWTVRRWDKLAPATLGPLTRLPRHPLALAGFGARGLPPATWAGRMFRTEEAKGLLAGASAHSFLPLSRPLTTSMGIMLLASAHVAGWPVAKGGSQSIVDAMAAQLIELGGRIETGRLVSSLADVPESAAVLFDVTPRQLLAICGDDLPAGYRRRLGHFRYGPGVHKVDYALSEPVPWANEACRQAGTLHVGGTLAEIAAAEAEVAAGRHPDRPFVLVGQQSLADPSRAPAGQHTLWTYCHTPNGSDVDMTDAIERQVERFAPGFRDVVLARHSAGNAWYEAYNPNIVGGDIAGGSHGGLQLLLRPRPGVRPYRTPNPRLYLCSASTPPGGGVHGMCGMHAAEDVLRHAFR